VRIVNLTEAIRTRRSVRKFSDKKVPDELVKEIIQDGLYAPTSCNQQLWYFVIIKDEIVKERLIAEAYSSTLIRRAPVILVAMYDSWNYKESIQASSMAVLNILLSATDKGLGSLAMNSYGADRKVKKVLGIPEEYQICCFVCLGYPNEEYKDYPRVPRRKVEEVINYNKFKVGDILPHSYDPENWSFNELIDYQKYYCRKTFLGKEMDISDIREKNMVRQVLKKVKGKVLDVCSYDGSYHSLFPKVNIIALDLSKETSEYTSEVIGSFVKTYGVYSGEINYKDINTTTLIFKAERLPSVVLKDILSKVKHKVIIISRRNNLFFGIFYNTIKLLFGDDVRKTGIYAFFGPYKPINSNKMKKMLKEVGFKQVTEKRYFLIPAFFDQALQMLIQYKKSEGSSYLHRNRHENIFTRILTGILDFQGIKESSFGSVSVFEAER